MAIPMEMLRSNSMSHSVRSIDEASDHFEVNNAYKFRGEMLEKWKRLVKFNSFLFLVVSGVWLAYLFLLSTSDRWHTLAIWIMWVWAAVWGIFTTGSSGSPSSIRIYVNSLITGFVSVVTWIYWLISLTKMVTMGIDDKYADRFDNFTFEEVNNLS